VYRKKGMDFVDILEKEIYPKYGQWFGKTVSFTYDVLDWKPVVKSKMDLLKKYKHNTIGDLKIKKILWNKIGDCLEWHLDNDSWIKFRLSGTEPKFKIYYNLFGDDMSILLNQYNKLDLLFKQMLGV
jgi:phosphomannomutase